MQDTFKGVQGYFKIEAIKDGQVVDSFEQKNLIMDLARNTFANLIAGINNTPVINRFVIGTQGHVAGDFLVPKGVDQGFTSEKTCLFSEEAGDELVDFESLYFIPTGVSGDNVTVENPNNASTVKIDVNGTDVVYEINIHNDACNGSTGTMVFTECAFYTGSEIFSMRTFKGKIKDNTVSLKITWKIMF